MAVCSNLPLADRATVLPWLYSAIDLGSTPGSYERYDSMTALESFRRFGVTQRAYEEFLKPTLLASAAVVAVWRLGGRWHVPGCSAVARCPGRAWGWSQWGGGPSPPPPPPIQWQAKMPISRRLGLISLLPLLQL